MWDKETQKIIRDIKEIGVYRQFLKTSSRIIGKSNKYHNKLKKFCFFVKNV